MNERPIMSVSSFSPERFLSAGITEHFQCLLGERIKGRRMAMRLTQAALAERVGMTRAALANIEIGRQRTSTVMLARLAHHLEISPGELIPTLPEAEARWKESRRMPIPEKAPMLEKQLGNYNISPEKKLGPEEALATIRAVRSRGRACKPSNRKKQEKVRES